MSLRLRLLLVIGTSLLVLWTAASVWMFIDLRREFRATLDERLAASAHMVAGVLKDLPRSGPAENAAGATGPDMATRHGVACEIRLLHGELVARAGNGPPGLGGTETGYSTRTIGGERWRTYTLEENGMRITTADRVERRQLLLREFMLAAALPFLIAVAGSLLALWLGVRRGLAPLESIRKALAERKPGALHPLPQDPLPAELVPLASTVNDLLQRMEQAIERERSFTGNAAHELRTPLTAVKTHVQVARLLSNDGSAAESLAQAEEGASRLQHTIDQLLMLARVEGPFSFGADQHADATAVARTALQQLAPSGRARVSIIKPADAGAVALPAVLAVTALRNLLDNALRNSPSDSAVQLSLTKTGDSMRFEVNDEGPGMSEAERAHALQRFWRKGSGHGSGLGLSIVAAIAERYGGRLELLPREQRGLSARLEFPLAREMWPAQQAAPGTGAESAGGQSVETLNCRRI
jgi:signal transduction histidine kinase